MSLRTFVPVWLSLVFLGAPAFATDNRPPLTDGTVDAIAVNGSTTYIGGKFTKIGEDTGSGVVFDSTTGASVAGWPYINGPVRVAIPDGAGGFYIGGDFSEVGGYTRHRVARLLANKTVDPSFDPNVGLHYTYTFFNSYGDSASHEASTVRCLLLNGSTLYIGGIFQQINGTVERWSLAAVNASTGAVLPFDPYVKQDNDFNLRDYPGQVNCLALHGSLLYLGGYLTEVNQASTPGGAGQQVRLAFAAVNKDSGVATAWDPNGPDSQPAILNDFLVPNAMAVSGSNLFIGGYSPGHSGANDIGGQQHPGSMAKLDLTTGEVASWNPTVDSRANSTVNAFVIVGTTIYVAGNGSEYYGAVGLWSVNSVSGVIGSWKPPVQATNGVGISMVKVGNSFYVSGGFLDANGILRNLCAVDLTTGEQTSWTPDRTFDQNFGVSGQIISTVCFAGGAIFAGGQFNVFNTADRINLAAFNTTTCALLPWSPNVYTVNNSQGQNDEVYSLTLQGGKVYVGGEFDTANLTVTRDVSGNLSFSGGTPRNRVAAFDATTGAVTAWDPNADATVRSLTSLGSTIYAAGGFSGVNNEAVQRIGLAAFDATTGKATAWNPVPDDLARVVATDGTRIYASGYFSTVNNGTATRRGLAALDPTTGKATAWNPNVIVSSNVGVLSLAISGSTVYAGGDFSAVNGSVKRNHAAAFDLTSGTVTAWNPDLDGPVDAVAVHGSIVYLGGAFQNANVARAPVARRLLGAFKVADGTATSFSPANSFNELRAGGINALAVAGERLFTAGSYGNISSPPNDDSIELDPSLYRAGFAAYSFSPTLSPAFFSGQTALSNGVYYLSFPSNNYFGYYSYLSDPAYIYHFDLGYEYVFDANDGKSGVYLYDFKSSDFFYTSPMFPFPYLYDFSLKTVLYYYPDPKNAGHYNTNGIRYFYRFDTGKIFSK